VLQCVAVCCSVLQCVAVCCSVLQCVAVCCIVLQCVAVCCSACYYVAVYLPSNINAEPTLENSYLWLKLVSNMTMELTLRKIYTVARYSIFSFLYDYGADIYIYTYINLCVHIHVFISVLRRLMLSVLKCGVVLAL